MSLSKQLASSCEEDDELQQSLLHPNTSEKDFIDEYNRSYYGNPKSKELYLFILSKLNQTILEGDFTNFERFSKSIVYLNGLESRSTLMTFCNDAENFLRETNLIILACKHNRADILEYLLSDRKIFECLPVFDENNLISPEDTDYTNHNAFYYAVRSGNVELLDILIRKWPGNYFATRCTELDEILSKTYEELKLKNVPLSEQVEIFVENELISLRFFSSRSGQTRNAEDNRDNIKKRIDLVLENIILLQSQYSNGEKVDDRFLFVARFIAQNIHVLKRQLKISYIRLPWEEMEFCLITFISSYMKQQENNLFYRAILNTNKILVYLKNFAEKLENEKAFIENVRTNENKLNDLSNLKRDKVIAQIINNDPRLTELYDDYQQIRDIHSLQKITEYLNLALSVDSAERKGHLIITRALQVIGEYLKNTLESPKLSNTNSELLLLSLPRNTQKVIINLRNSLSHVYSLSKRTEIEEKSNADFFFGIQKDTMKIQGIINNILFNNKIKMIRILLKRVLDSEGLDEVKAVAEVLKNVKFNDIKADDFKIMEFGDLEKLVGKLNHAMNNKTNYEKKLFHQLNQIISDDKTKSKNIKTDYTVVLSLFKTFCTYLKDDNFDNVDFRVLKSSAFDTLESMVPQTESHNFKRIVELSLEIARSVQSRTQDDELDEIKLIAREILLNAEFETKDIKWLEKLKGKLNERDSLSPLSKQLKARRIINEKKYNELLTSKLSELKSILKNDSSNNKLIERLLFFKNNKNLLAAVEMLVLDIMSILDRPEKHLENNIFFLDDNAPLLTGKCLRNHLAHGNTLLDVLLCDPSVVVILNAEKLISGNNITTNKSKKKGDSLMKDDSFTLKDKYHQRLNVLSNQKKMFVALENGNFEDFNNYVQKGADIHARDLDSSTSLHFAARSPNIEVLKFVVEQNLDVNVKNNSGQSPLHIAVAFGRRDIVEYLISKASASVNDSDTSNITPLHVAAKNGHKDIVEILLKNNADTNAKDDSGVSPVHYAIQNNKLDVAKVLLEDEPNVDSNETLVGCTSLHIAAEFGNLELVNFLLENEANANAKNDEQRTPLHSAALNGCPEIITALIQRKADVNAKVFDGRTPLHYAVHNGQKKAAAILLKHGANVNASDMTYKNTTLHYAAKDGLEEIVEILLKYGANVHATTFEGLTPLHLAAQKNHLKIVTSLLKHGANVRSKDKCNFTPLHYAAMKGHKQVAEFLIQNRAEIDAKTGYNFTPLYLAAREGYTDIVNLLIKNKAKIDSRDIHGGTPLFSAVGKGYKDVVDLLLKNGARVDDKTNDGKTPLHIAALGGHKDVATLLLNCHADINAKDINGFTPLYGAVLEGHKDMVQLLVENEANVNAKGNLPARRSTHTSSELITMLHLAVEAGYKEIVKILLANGADINAKCSDQTPLLSSIINNHKEIVEFLIAKGAEVNLDGTDPLLMAVMRGRKDIVDILLRNQVRVNIKSSNGITPLHWAAKMGHTDIAKALIIKGRANVNATYSGFVTPLHNAALEGHEEVAQLLIENGADVNAVSSEGTALHLAAGCGHDSVVDVLLRNGVKIDVTDYDKRTPLQLSVGRGHLQVVKMLMQYQKASLNDKCNGGWTLLHIASQESNLEIVKYLVNEGADIHAKNFSDSKPIHIATREGFRDTVEFFLSKGLKVDERGGSDNQTLLFYAVAKNQVEIIKYLISQGADVNAKDNRGFSPVHFAVIFGSKNTVEVLLENGAVYNAVDDDNRTPLDMVNMNVPVFDTYTRNLLPFAKNMDIFNLLSSTEKLFGAIKSKQCSVVRNYIKSGAFVNAKHDNTESTPLHYAAWKGCDDIVAILIQNNANVNAPGKNGFTPLHYAAKFSHLECIKILLSHGAIYNAAAKRGKTPSDYAMDESISKLFNLIDALFSKIKNADVDVILILNTIKDNDTLKAIMNARNRENKSLIAAALQHKFAMVEHLKDVSQDNVAEQFKEAAAFFQEGDYQRSLNLFKNLYEKKKRILGPDNPSTLDVQTYVAKGLYKVGNYQEALDMLEEIFEKQEESLGSNNKFTLNTRSTIALVLHFQRKDKQALGIFEEVYRKEKEILGENDLQTITTKFHMGLVLERLERNDEALNINRAVFNKFKEILGEDDQSTVSAQNNIAMVLNNLGKYEEALKLYTDVFEKKQKMFGISHVDTLRTLQNIAAVFFKQNKHQESLKTYREVLHLQNTCLKKNHPEIVTTKFNIATVLLAQEKCISAYKMYNECLQQQKIIYGPYDPIVCDTLQKLELIKRKFSRERIDLSEIFQNLNSACNNGDIKVVKRLLKEGADANDEDIDGRTPLHFAASKGHIDIVKVLLKKGADVTKATNKGNTLLHTATSAGHKVVVEILLQHVSDDKLNDLLNAKTASNGTTALHVAAKNGLFEVVKSLLKHGAAYNIADNKGKLPIDLSKNDKIVDLLKLIDELFNDVENDRSEIIDKLKVVKPDEFAVVTNARNNQNHNLLTVAVITNQRNIASELMKMLKRSN